MAFSLKDLFAPGPERIAAKRVSVSVLPVEELVLTFFYILAAGVWCVFSDDFFDWVMGQRLDSPALQAMKGINFVTTTSLILYVVLRRTFHARRAAQEAQRLTQERFEFVAQATTDAIWDLNLETKVTWWSDGLHRLFGYRPQDVSTKFDWWLDHLHPKDRDETLRAVLAAGQQGKQTWASQYRFRRADGSYAVVLDRGCVIRDAAGKPLRIVGGLADISERLKAQEALESSRQQLRALTARLQSSREEERALVAREIHDELGQVLSAIKINLDWLERKLGEPSFNALLERVVESSEMAASAIQSVQRIASDLRPAVLDDLGLVAALESEARRFQQRTGIACELQLPSDPPDLSRDYAIAIFRVFQEALTNAARHAQASQVAARFTADTAHLSLQVEDNGQGIQPEAIADSRSLGLLGMRERAAALGGDVAVAPITPHGTRVTLRLPRPAQGERKAAGP